jgi:hypothetical protein
LTHATMAPRPRFVTLGILWGALLGFPLTIAAAIIPAFVMFFMQPTMGGESLAYLMVFGVSYCSVLFLPALIGGGLVGTLLGLYYRRHARRIDSRTAIGLGVGMAALLFLVAAVLFYIVFRGSPFLDLHYAFALIWLVPTLVLMMGAYTLLSSWLNRRLPT